MFAAFMATLLTFGVASAKDLKITGTSASSSTPEMKTSTTSLPTSPMENNPPSGRKVPKVLGWDLGFR